VHAKLEGGHGVKMFYGAHRAGDLNIMMTKQKCKFFLANFYDRSEELCFISLVLRKEICVCLSACVYVRIQLVVCLKFEKTSRRTREVCFPQIGIRRLRN